MSNESYSLYSNTYTVTTGVKLGLKSVMYGLLNFSHVDGCDIIHTRAFCLGGVVHHTLVIHYTLLPIGEVFTVKQNLAFEKFL